MYTHTLAHTSGILTTSPCPERLYNWLHMILPALAPWSSTRLNAMVLCTPLATSLSWWAALGDDALYRNHSWDMPKNEAALDFDLLLSFLRVDGLRVGVVVVGCW